MCIRDRSVGNQPSRNRSFTDYSLPGDTRSSMTPQPDEAAPGSASTKPLDGHVHVIGTGAGGTGCWLRLRGWRRPFARMLLQHIGLPGSALQDDFDRIYVERLLEMIRSSSLGAVVILAQEQPYDERGVPHKEQGAFYVPNDY